MTNIVQSYNDFLKMEDPTRYFNKEMIDLFNNKVFIKNLNAFKNYDLGSSAIKDLLTFLVDKDENLKVDYIKFTIYLRDCFYNLPSYCKRPIGEFTNFCNHYSHPFFSWIKKYMYDLHLYMEINDTIQSLCDAYCEHNLNYPDKKISEILNMLNYKKLDLNNISYEFNKLITVKNYDKNNTFKFKLLETDNFEIKQIITDIEYKRVINKFKNCVYNPEYVNDFICLFTVNFKDKEEILVSFNINSYSMTDCRHPFNRKVDDDIQQNIKNFLLNSFEKNHGILKVRKKYVNKKEFFKNLKLTKKQKDTIIEYLTKG